MDRKLIVDAMNVIGSRPTGWWRDRPGAVRDLVARLDSFATHTGTRVTVVIDGRPLAGLDEGRRGALEILYARRRGPDAADDRIIELLEQGGPPVEVVTADRDLRARAEALGAGVVGPAHLLRALDRVAAGREASEA